MAYSEDLAGKVRSVLTNPKPEEKKMFGGLAFMVKGKMCVAVGKGQLMCRIDPAVHDEAIAKAGVTTVTMGGKEYKGYVYVDETLLKSRKSLEYWIGLALDFNEQAKATRRSSNKQSKAGR